MAHHQFLAPGSGVSIPVKAEREQPARRGDATDREPQIGHRHLDLHTLDFSTPEGQFALGFHLGNQIFSAIYGK